MKILLASLLMFVAAVSQAVILEWNANSETNLAGYRVYVGSLSRQYATNFTTTNTVFEIANTNLFNSTNYFSVTAFDTEGLESDFSDEVFWIRNTNRPARVNGLRFRKLFVQSAPTVLGPWSQGEEITQVETAFGTGFFRLQLDSAPPSAPGSLKRFMPTPVHKGGNVHVLPKPPRPFMLPPMPPQINR